MAMPMTIGLTYPREVNAIDGNRINVIPLNFLLKSAEQRVKISDTYLFLMSPRPLQFQTR